MKLEGYTNRSEHQLNTAIMNVVGILQTKKRLTVAEFWVKVSALPNHREVKDGGIGLQDLDITTRIDLLIELSDKLYVR